MASVYTESRSARIVRTGRYHVLTFYRQSLDQLQSTERKHRIFKTVTKLFNQCIQSPRSVQIQNFLELLSAIMYPKNMQIDQIVNFKVMEYHSSVNGSNGKDLISEQKMLHEFYIGHLKAQIELPDQFMITLHDLQSANQLNYLKHLFCVFDKMSMLGLVTQHSIRELETMREEDFVKLYKELAPIIKDTQASVVMKEHTEEQHKKDLDELQKIIDHKSSRIFELQKEIAELKNPMQTQLNKKLSKQLTKEEAQAMIINSLEQQAASHRSQAKAQRNQVNQYAQAVKILTQEKFDTKKAQLVKNQIQEKFIAQMKLEHEQAIRKVKSQAQKDAQALAKAMAQSQAQDQAQPQAIVEPVPAPEPQVAHQLSFNIAADIAQLNNNFLLIPSQRATPRRTTSPRARATPRKTRVDSVQKESPEKRMNELHKKKIDELKQEIIQLQDQLEQKDREIEELEDKLDDADEEQEELTEKIDNLEDLLKEVQPKVVQMETLIQEQKIKLHEAEELKLSQESIIQEQGFKQRYLSGEIEKLEDELETLRYEQVSQKNESFAIDVQPSSRRYTKTHGHLSHQDTMMNDMLNELEAEQIERTTFIQKKDHRPSVFNENELDLTELVDDEEEENSGRLAENQSYLKAGIRRQGSMQGLPNQRSTIARRSVMPNTVSEQDEYASEDDSDVSGSATESESENSFCTDKDTESGNRGSMGTPSDKGRLQIKI